MSRYKAFLAFVQDLTVQQRRQLAERGIPQPRLSEWQLGKRVPTRHQVLQLAEVTRVHPLRIERAVMLFKLDQEQARLFSELLEKDMGESPAGTGL